MLTTPYALREGPGAEASNSHLSRALNEWLTKAGPSELYRTCASCRQMRRGENGAQVPAHCDRFGVAPPIDIIMRGCDQHEDEAIAPY